MLDPEYTQASYYISGVRPGEKIHEILISEDEARNRVEDNGDYYIIHPHWNKAIFPERREYSSNLQTIDDSHELERLLLSADNVSWNYPRATKLQ
jgi:FlaA1/EpsC-like NDP-sugar epimerase